MTVTQVGEGTIGMTNEGTPTFGERLRDTRVGSGLSQADLTKRSGVPKTMLSRYENDHILPSISTLGRLADALRVHSSVLLGNGASASDAFTAALRDGGVELKNDEDAKQLAGVICDMVGDHDARVSFLEGSGETETAARALS